MKSSIQNKFKTPENYFDDLEKDILAKTTIGGSAKVIPLYRSNAFKIAMSMAAAFLLIVGLWFFNPSTTVQPQDQEQVQSLVYDIYFEDVDREEFVFEDEPILAEYVGISNP